MKCPTCRRQTLTGDKCVTCLIDTLQASDRELTKVLLEIVKPINMNDLPNPFDAEFNEN